MQSRCWNKQNRKWWFIVTRHFRQTCKKWVKFRVYPLWHFFFFFNAINPFSRTQWFHYKWSTSTISLPLFLFTGFSPYCWEPLWPLAKESSLASDNTHRKAKLLFSSLKFSQCFAVIWLAVSICLFALNPRQLCTYLYQELAAFIFSLLREE